MNEMINEIIKFEPFRKITRLSREVIITEKIDGSNAQVYIFEQNGEMRIMAGSRNRWLGPGKADNFGFYNWVTQNTEELLKLGPGRHYGEWWGLGIQRGYNLSERRFSLFNTATWSDPTVRPACCSVVPVLYRGNFDTTEIEKTIDHLRAVGSIAANGFPSPEGIVIYHTASGQLFKKTLENDEKPKGLTNDQNS